MPTATYPADFVVYGQAGYHKGGNLCRSQLVSILGPQATDLSVIVADATAQTVWPLDNFVCLFDGTELCYVATRVSNALTLSARNIGGTQRTQHEIGGTVRVVESWELIERYGLEIDAIQREVGKTGSQNFLRRDGTNDMQAPLDFAGQEGINLGAPMSPDSAARLSDVDSGSSGAVATHEAAADPHPQYATSAEVDTIADVSASDAVTAHVAASDPHSGYQLRSEKGANNGYAGLDSAGKVPVTQLPNSIMQYQGNWDASTNTPTLADGAGNADDDVGDVYRVSVAGTQDLGSGPIVFRVGDYTVLNASKVWEKSDTSDSVVSVNGQGGVVVLDSDDVAEGSTNLYFSDERAQDAAGAMVSGNTEDGVTVTYDDPTAKLNFTNTDKGSTAVAAHVAAADPHPNYTTAAEATTIADASAASAVATHAAAGDPHAGYQLESEKGAASGYAGLDSASKLTPAQLHKVIALTDGATPALDASLGSIFTLLATASRTIAIPTNPTDGQKIVIRHTASGGAWTLSLNTGAGGFNFGTTVTGLTATTSGTVDYVGCIYSAASAKWAVVAYSKGFT